MVKRSTGDIEDRVMKDHVDSLQAESLQNVIELSAAPTADEPLIEDNEVGQNGSDLYFRVGSTIYKVTADATITVT